MKTDSGGLFTHLTTIHTGVKKEKQISKEHQTTGGGEEEETERPEQGR